MSKGSIGRIYMRRLREYTRAILDFLLYAKGRGIIHGDIKPDNILLTAAGKVRVTDFGWSSYLKHKTQHVCGTLPYMAPELLLGYYVTGAVDMWALGCTVAEMATRKYLFDSRTFTKHLPYCIKILGMPPKKMVDEAPNKTTYFDPEGLPYNLSKQVAPGSLPLHRALQGQHPQLVDFVRRCLQWDPNLRMTPEQALAHSWLQTTTTTTTRDTTRRATPTVSEATPTNGTIRATTTTTIRGTSTASEATTSSKATPTASEANPTTTTIRATTTTTILATTTSEATTSSKATPTASEANPTTTTIRATTTTILATTASEATTSSKATPTASEANPTTIRATTVTRATTTSEATPTASEATPTTTTIRATTTSWADTTNWATITISSSGGTTPVQGSAAAEPR
ncbi:dual specificity tyrosine-phosphorylation-regulated kinase 2-like [Petromyzon marinus]|uniref:dual specificity tyrosine-phosphorylation-regulated kinase 2-like n=1 Tax=Petromyzon marinus TaxID=7757 RepID=UPI003F70E8F7